jgi:hypothetical protein
VAKKPKVAPWPVAAERAVEAQQLRIDELKRACKLAHDTLADIAGRLGPSMVTADIDTAFRELVRVLYIDNPERG